MDEEIKELLDEEIRYETDHLKELEPGSPEHSAAVESLGKLYEMKLKKSGIKREKLDRIFKWCELALPLTFYGIWFIIGLCFEREGTFSYQALRSLISRFKPTKK